MLEALLEFVFQVVARFVGVTVVAAVTWCGSGFRHSYSDEWRRLFDKYDGVYEWVDVLGLFVIVATVAALVLLVWVALP